MQGSTRSSVNRPLDPSLPRKFYSGLLIETPFKYIIEFSADLLDLASFFLKYYIFSLPTTAKFTHELPSSKSATLIHRPQSSKKKHDKVCIKFERGLL